MQKTQIGVIHKFWKHVATLIGINGRPFFSVGGVLLLYLALAFCFFVVIVIHESVWPESFHKYWYYDSPLSFLLLTWVVFYLRPELIPLSRWHPRWTDFAAGIPLGVLVPAILWLTLRDPVETLRLHPLPRASILPILFLGPVVEEIIFRGTVLKSFKSYFPSAVAVLLATLLVSFIHPHFWTVMPIQLALSVLYVVTGDSMPATIICHITNNAFVFALTTPAAEKCHAYVWSIWR